MATLEPDLFTNVHKGIRKALFETCLLLGRAGEDEALGGAARQQLREVLHFVAHHGENEDLLLLPLLEQTARPVFDRMAAAHARIEEALLALRTSADTAPTMELYAQLSGFIVLYVEHMLEEERDLDPLIRAAVPVEELAGFGQRSVQRTSPADKQMMLGWMLPVMTRVDVDAFLSRLPPAVAESVRPLAGNR
jgi:hypothetical protein